MSQIFDDFLLKLAEVKIKNMAWHIFMLSIQYFELLYLYSFSTDNTDFYYPNKMRKRNLHTLFLVSYSQTSVIGF
jgi:hypothetical protein